LQAWLKSTQGFSLEIVLTTQTPKLPEAQKIWALESESHTLCALVQREGELVWVYDLPRPWQTWNAAHAIPMGSLTPEEGSLHFHITFDGHNHWQTWKENIPADNATPNRTHQSFTHEPAALVSSVPQRICFGSDAEQESRWQGEIAGLALYDRALPAEEITTSYTRFGKKD
jgi:hypothetical protein